MFSDEYAWCIVFQDLGYTVFSTVCAFYLPCMVMMVIYGKVFQAARARIHKKRFRSQPQQQQQQQQLPCHKKQQKQLLKRRQEQQKSRLREKHELQNEEHKQQLKSRQEQLQQQQQQQQSDVDAGPDAGQFISSTTDGIAHAVSPDDGGGGDSIVSHSPSDRQVLGTNVTLTVLACDDDDDDDDAEDQVVETAAASVGRGPLQTVPRPTRLALSGPDRNGTISPSESVETPSRSVRLLTTSQRDSPTPSLRGSWLDLTKQFIMDRKKRLSPKSKVSYCVLLSPRRKAGALRNGAALLYVTYAN